MRQPLQDKTGTAVERPQEPQRPKWRSEYQANIEYSAAVVTQEQRTAHSEPSDPQHPTPAQNALVRVTAQERKFGVHRARVPRHSCGARAEDMAPACNLRNYERERS